MMLRVVAKPLGVNVVTFVEAALRPLEDAEIDVTPGVALVVKFATAKAVPRMIVTWSVTVPTLSCEEVRKTTVSFRAREAFPAELWRATTIAG